ncbi:MULTISPECIES: chromosome partitioning protein ParB [Natrialba]|uniref:chromosome partitioning protein ParB n=1 Tax=Natrialba TaxID=63742 RepID=UPI001F4C59DD|nr:MULTISPECIES: chromosome partitioning protein ParB [Natrialba]
MAEPFTVIKVNPKKIQSTAPGNIDRWKHIGEVRSGNWDQSNKSLNELIKYRSVVDRFQNDVAWENTEIYSTAIERVSEGEVYWNGCRTINDIEQRAKSIEDLYASIQESGFKSQSELQGRSVKSIVLSGSFDRSKTDIAVAISRNGDFLFIDGNHRLAISHVLELDEIPVRIVVRHSEWQNLREEVMNANSKEELSERAKSNINHPDIAETVPDSWVTEQSDE